MTHQPVLPRPALSAVVPCYNEEQSLPEITRRLSAACRAICGGDFEIVLVDDGSKDATWQVMQDLAACAPEVVAIKLARNHGHQLALSAGLEICQGERIFVIDADLQDPPELLGPMMARMDEGVHVVYGRRAERKGETLFKRVTAASFYRFLNRLTDVPIPNDTGDFRLMSRTALDHLLAMPERHRFIRGMVAWIGLSQEPFDYVRESRFAGETKYPLRKMLALAADAITGFSVKPLRLASWLGLFFAMIAVLMLIYTLVSWAFFTTVSGWASVMVAVLVLGSVQLLVLGVLGEYLGRMFMESKGRPLYIIDRIVTGKSAASAFLDSRVRPAACKARPAGAAPNPMTGPAQPAK